MTRVILEVANKLGLARFVDQMPMSVECLIAGPPFDDEACWGSSAHELSYIGPEGPDVLHYVQGHILRLARGMNVGENAPTAPLEAVRVVHMTRDPLEMIISAYLYHSQEIPPEAWLERPTAPNLLLPRLIGTPEAELSHHELLRQSSEADGLEISAAWMRQEVDNMVASETWLNQTFAPGHRVSIDLQDFEHDRMKGLRSILSVWGAEQWGLSAAKLERLLDRIYIKVDPAASISSHVTRPTGAAAADALNQRKQYQDIICSIPWARDMVCQARGALHLPPGSCCSF